MTSGCLDNGSFYVLACGPRGNGALELPFEVWKRKYSAGWHEYDADLLDKYAAKFDKRIEELGGRASYDGGQAYLATKAWEDRDQVVVADEEAAGFVWHTCRIMRESDGGAEYDIGPGYSWLAGGSLGAISGEFLYQHCKR